MPAAPAPSDIRVKGAAFRSVLGACEDHGGVEFRDRVLAEIPGAAGEALRLGSVVSSGWYPCEWYREMYRVIVRVSGDRDIALQLGRVSARREVKGALKLLFRVLTVPMLLNQAARVFGLFFEGKLRIEKVDRGFVRGLFFDCHGFDRNLWLDQLGACEAFLELHGAKNPTVRVIRGGGDDDAEMDVEFHWGGGADAG